MEERNFRSFNESDDNLQESFMSLDDPSLSINENFMGLIVIGKHIEPIEVPEGEALFENTNID